MQNSNTLLNMVPVEFDGNYQGEIYHRFKKMGITLVTLKTSVKILLSKDIIKKKN